MKKKELKDNNGTFGWSGMAGTLFSVDPKEELILIFMTIKEIILGVIFIKHLIILPMRA